MTAMIYCEYGYCTNDAEMLVEMGTIKRLFCRDCWEKMKIDMVILDLSKLTS